MKLSETTQDKPTRLKLSEVAPVEKPVEPPKPTLGQEMYGGAYGLGTTLVGGLGDIESLVTTEATTPELKGYETVFPTTQNVRTGLTKIGVPQPAPGTEASVTLGEYAPAIVGGATLLKGLGTYGLGKVTDLSSLLLGKKTAKQAEEVAKSAKEAEMLGGQNLTAAQQQKRKLLEEETAKALQKQEAAQTRQSIAQRTGKKEEERGGRSLRELVGVRTLPEAGTFKPIPQTPTQIGNFIREQAENFVKSIKAQRDTAAKTSFANAKNEAALKQSLGQYVDTQPLISNIDQLIAKGGSTDYIRSINQLRNDLAATKNFEGLEVIRRRLGDAAFGLPEEGYKAIGQGFAKDMYKSLAEQMRSYSSDFAKYLDDYKKLSKTIEAHGTKVGKGLTETQDAAGKYYTKTAEQIANDIFSSPEKYKTFIDAVGGNKQIAEAAARRYFAGLAETAKTPKAVEELFRKNRAVLDEMPSVRKEITDRYLSSLKQAERRTAGAKSVTKESEIAQDVAKQELTNFDKQISAQLKGIEKGKTLFSDSVEALASAKPNEAIKTFEETVLPKIREAEAAAGTQLLSQQQIQVLRQQVQQLEKISDKTVRARIVTGLLGTILIGEAGVSRIKQITGIPSGE